MKENDALWQYSRCLYSNPDIERWCLWLQDQHGANVNLVLFCCFAGVVGVSLDKDAFRKLDDLICDWDETVILPLRAIRRNMRHKLPSGDWRTVRQIIQQAELAAERQLQGDLARWLPEQDCRCDNRAEQLIRDNLNGYLTWRGINGFHEQGSEPLVNPPDLTVTPVIEAALRAASTILG